MALTSFLELSEPGKFDVHISGIGAAEAEVGAGTPYKVDSIQKYPIGTILRRGFKTFVYCYAGGTVHTEWAAYKSKKTNTVAVAPTQDTTEDPVTGLAAGVAGSYYVSVTIDSVIGHLVTGELWANELAGGEIVIGNGGSQHPQQRTIVSHPALAAAGTLTVKLDSPLERAVTAGTTTIELMESPFSYVKADGSGGEYVTYLGMATVEAVSGEFFWLQTYGPRWITSNSNTCDSAMDRTIVFVGNGSVVSSNDVTVESGLQIAGYALDTSGSNASNAPMVFLTLMR
jgi:hypothetical protein